MELSIAQRVDCCCSCQKHTRRLQNVECKNFRVYIQKVTSLLEGCLLMLNCFTHQNTNSPSSICTEILQDNCCTGKRNMIKRGIAYKSQFLDLLESEANFQYYQNLFSYIFSALATVLCMGSTDFCFSCVSSFPCFSNSPSFTLYCILLLKKLLIRVHPMLLISSAGQ